MPITNKLNLPQPFVEAATQSHTYTPKRYSVTQLLKGEREAILTRRHADEIETDVADSVWLIFGSAVHSILEKAQESETQLKENYITVDMPNGYVLSGIFDLYDDATGCVTDYKTASVWKVIYNEWDDYRTQTLAYCWMLRKMGFNARKGQIVALLKDHSKTKAERDHTYPQHPVHVVSWYFTDKDFAEIEAFITQKFAEIEKAEKAADADLPVCTPEQRWHKPGKFAVMKKGRKTAIRLYDSKEEAEERVKMENQLTPGNLYSMEERQGTDQKCTQYCQVCKWCSYWQENYGKESK